MIKNDTIVAISTAPGAGAIGVVRLSGNNLREIAGVLSAGKTPAPRRAMLARFADAQGATIDEGLALYFPAPHSYTGEDVLELQTHGSPVVLRMLLARCLELGARLAEPGEFTRRAFLNGKLDLAQAESIIDLINATSSQAARSALRSLSGEFSSDIRRVVDRLIELRVFLEATLDFPEEETVFLEQVGWSGRLEAVSLALGKIIEASRQGRLLQEGITVALLGRPNVGKSSLLNRLAGEEVAIVTDIPGTTRDAIAQVIHIEGVPLHIVDTAGLRETADPVEKIGIDRTWATARKSDVALVLVDAQAGVLAEDREILAQLPEDMTVILVFNKVDLGAPKTLALGGDVPRGTSVVEISAKTGLGIDHLKATLLEIAGWHPAEEGVYLARTRQLEALRLAQIHIAQAIELGNTTHLELLAEDLRLAQQALNTITGEFTTDDLLGEIFSRFCLGK